MLVPPIKGGPQFPVACAKTLQLPRPLAQTKMSWRRLLTSQYSR